MIKGVVSLADYPRVEFDDALVLLLINVIAITISITRLIIPIDSRTRSRLQID